MSTTTAHQHGQNLHRRAPARSPATHGHRSAVSGCTAPQTSASAPTTQPRPLLRVNPAIQILKQTNGTNNDNPPSRATRRPDRPGRQHGHLDLQRHGPEQRAAHERRRHRRQRTPGDTADDFHPRRSSPAASMSATPTTTTCSSRARPGSTPPRARPRPASTATSAPPPAAGNVSNTPVTANNLNHYFAAAPSSASRRRHPFNEVGHRETFTITVTALPDTSQLNAADVTFATPTITYPGGMPYSGRP